MFRMLRLSSVVSVLGVVLVLIQASASPAAVPQLISHQGRLTSSAGTPFTGVKLTKFTLYNGAGTNIWNSGFISVSYSDGLFSVLLGQTPQPVLPSSIWATDSSVTLGITVDTDPELTPRIRLATVAHAYHALQADSITGDPFVNEAGDQMTGGLSIDYGSNGVDIDIRQDGGIASVIELKSGGNLKTQLVGSDKGHLVLIDNSGDATAILDATPASGGILDLRKDNGAGGAFLAAGTTLTGAYLSLTDAASAQVIRLDGNAVGDASVVLPAGAISGIEILDGAVTSAKITDGVVSSLKIQDATIVNADINAAAAITASKISGTAATLSATQTFAGTTNTFDGEIVVNDSTFRANSIGVRIGDPAGPSSTVLLYVERDYDVGTSRWGQYNLVRNAGIGITYGIQAQGEATGAGDVNSGAAYGGWFRGTSDNAARYGVYATGTSQDAAIATGGSYGVYGIASEGAQAIGVYGTTTGTATTEYGGYFSGNVHCTGTLSKGAGAFKIDHPLDPENKYLQHSFVESPDMMNIYNGNVTLDANGEAVVQLPTWFTALNKDFRYQLTAIGAPGPNLYIASEVNNNQFQIAGGQSLSRVSWQVTGVRHDIYADANRIQVEVAKQPQERGTYMHPEAFGLGEERFVNYEQEKAAREADSRTPDQAVTDNQK